MDWNFIFFFNCVLLGVGLAMDAFSVSLSNGLNEPKMPRRKMRFIAGIFGGFQALMPMLGWICVHTVVQFFHAFEKFIPWIALLLLVYIGVKMLIDGIKNNDDSEAAQKNGIAALLIQGIATSIDALSVGFAISEYDWLSATICSLIIAAVTFIICMCGLAIGKKFGAELSGKASIIGGIILIAIGIEVFIKGIF